MVRWGSDIKGGRVRNSLSTQTSHRVHTGGWCVYVSTYLVGAEAVGLAVVLDGEAVVEEEAVVALLPVRVVHLSSLSI